MLRGENPSRVLDDVHKAVDELNNETLPEGTRIHPFMDRTDLVNTTLHTVSHTLFEGMVLVVLVLILFLGSWRGALLVALTIPLSLLIAFILMHVTNIPANLLSLGAIDFGILVDGAIVMMETVLKKRERHPDEVLTEDSILRRTTEVARPIFFSTLIIITAYLPLFAFEHIEKKLFTPMAYTVGYALLGALCVALFLIPGLAFYAYRKPGKIYHNRWLEKLSTAYHSQIVRLMEKPRRVIVPLLAILLGAGILSYTVGKDFLPPLDEGAIWIQVQLPPGISIEKSKEMGAELRKTLKEFKEVSYVMTQVGRDDEGAEAFSLSHVECGVGLKPYSTWKFGKTKADLIEEMAAKLETIPTKSGAMDAFASWIITKCRTIRSAELIAYFMAIFGVVATHSSTNTIIFTGPFVRTLMDDYKDEADHSRSANILDATACGTNGLIPHGNPALVITGVATGVAGVPATFSFLDFLPYNFHCWGLLIIFFLSIMTGIGRKRRKTA